MGETDQQPDLRFHSLEEFSRLSPGRKKKRKKQSPEAAGKQAHQDGVRAKKAEKTRGRLQVMEARRIQEISDIKEGRAFHLQGEYFFLSDHAISRYRDRCQPQMTLHAAMLDLRNQIQSQAKVLTHPPSGYVAGQRLRRNQKERYLRLDNLELALPCLNAYRRDSVDRWEVLTALAKEMPGGEDDCFVFNGNQQFGEQRIRLSDSAIKDYQSRAHIKGGVEETRLKLILRLQTEARISVKPPRWLIRKPKQAVAYIVFVEAHTTQVFPLMRDPANRQGLLSWTAYCKYINAESRPKKDKRKTRLSPAEQLAELTG
jgi:hypothetical protein